MKIGTPSKKVVIFGLSGVLLLAVAALLVFYGLSMWPKQQSSSNDKNEPAIVSTGNVKTETPTPAMVETTKSSSTANLEARMLRTYVVVKTKEQGNCTLSLSNAKNRYTIKNSSIGVDNAVGCLQWNVSTDGMEKGDYDLVVEFKGTKDHATVRQKVTL